MPAVTAAPIVANTTINTPFIPGLPFLPSSIEDAPGSINSIGMIADTPVISGRSHSNFTFFTPDMHTTKYKPNTAQYSTAPTRAAADRPRWEDHTANAIKINGTAGSLFPTGQLCAV